jgi:endogenous inhibitor of DNA gyrase (YacG/DUF329 family)
MIEKLVPFPDRRAARKRKKCPVCGRLPQPESEPFCSKRCQDEDLRRWLTGDYRIPTREIPDPDGGTEPQ